MKSTLSIIIMSLCCSLNAPICHSQVTYRLVTDNYQIDTSSKYLLVAKEYNQAAGESTISNSKRFLTSYPITKNDDNTITYDDSFKAHLYVFRNFSHKNDMTYPECQWKLFDFINNIPYSVATKKSSGNGELALNSDFKGAGVEYLSVDISADGTAYMMFDNGPKQHIRFDGDKGRFICQPKNEYANVALYRVDNFNFKIDDDNSTTEIIVVTSTWKEDPNNRFDQPISIYYLFNNGASVTKDQIISHGAIASGNDNRVEIPRNKEYNTLWIIGEYLPPTAVDKKSYSHIFKATPNTGSGTKPTDSTHFSVPKTTGYKFKEPITIAHDNDVKIYYALNGEVPTVPTEGQSPLPPTYDLDNTPIIYMGQPITIKFIAVKSGFAPSELVTLAISGESVPKTDTNSFKTPVDKTYAINETVVFERDNDVKIYYTIDGSQPVIPDKQEGIPMGSSTFDLDNTPILYKGTPINIKFIAVKKDYLPSDVISVTIRGELSKTELDVHFKKPASKSYNLNETVIFERDADVKIYYTLNGSEPVVPDAANGIAMGQNTYDLDNTPIVYKGQQLNINFIAVKSGFGPSVMVSVTIKGEIMQTQLDVHFKKPAEKSYAINETVIFLRDTDVKIYYTLDGSEPSAPDEAQMIPMGVHTYDLDKIPLIYKGTTLKVNFVAIKKGFRQSDMISIVITGELNPTLLDVHFKTPANGGYSLNEQIIFLRDNDVKIYYTLDGSDPIVPQEGQSTPPASSTTFDLDTTPVVYQGTPLNIKFIAVKKGFSPSDIISIRITGDLKPTELDVHFRKPVDKSYAINETVIFMRDEDVKIYYTIDSSKPVVPNGISENHSTFDLDLSPLVYLGKPIDLKFIAIKEGFKASEVISVTIKGESLPKTQINSHFYILKEKNYKFKETVRFEKFNDVKIYYTLDGSDPVIPTEETKSSSTFDIDQTPIIYMGETLHLKIIAIKTGLSPSDIISFTLTGEPVPQTKIDVHFKRPAEKVYELNEPIIFIRDNDVKIYYTLDGQKPELPQTQSRADSGAEHQGKTYDLDYRSLAFQGEAINIKFVAVKKDYLPSDVCEYAIDSKASGITDIPSDQNTPAEYYNLQGIRVSPPLQPGLYIIKQGSKAKKVIIN